MQRRWTRWGPSGRTSVKELPTPLPNDFPRSAQNKRHCQLGVSALQAVVAAELVRSLPGWLF